MRTIILILLTGKLLSQTPFKKFNGLDDKTKHMAVSTCISWPISIIVYKITDKPVISALLGFAAALTVGVGKELIHDKWMRKGTFSYGDIGADAWGSAVGSVSAGINIGVKRHVEQIEFEKFQELNIPSVTIADPLIIPTSDTLCIEVPGYIIPTDTLIINNLNN